MLHMKFNFSKCFPFSCFESVLSKLCSTLFHFFYILRIVTFILKYNMYKFKIQIHDTKIITYNILNKMSQNEFDFKYNFFD